MRLLIINNNHLSCRVQSSRFKFEAVFHGPFGPPVKYEKFYPPSPLLPPLGGTERRMPAGGEGVFHQGLKLLATFQVGG
jgi:hypothetical protein